MFSFITFHIWNQGKILQKVNKINGKVIEKGLKQL